MGNWLKSVLVELLKTQKFFLRKSRGNVPVQLRENEKDSVKFFKFIFWPIIKSFDVARWCSEQSIPPLE